jgi:hypothetical protein
MFITFVVLRGVLEHSTASGSYAWSLGRFVLELTRLKMHRNCAATSCVWEGSHRAIFFRAEAFNILAPELFF